MQMDLGGREVSWRYSTKPDAVQRAESTLILLKLAFGRYELAIERTDKGKQVG